MNNLGVKIKLECLHWNFIRFYISQRDVKIPPQKTKSCYSKKKNFQTEENFNFIHINALALAIQ